jgi:hypothetical protein
LKDLKDTFNELAQKTKSHSLLEGKNNTKNEMPFSQKKSLSSSFEEVYYFMLNF